MQISSSLEYLLHRYFIPIVEKRSFHMNMATDLRRSEIARRVSPGRRGDDAQRDFYSAKAKKKIP